MERTNKEDEKIPITPEPKNLTSSKYPTEQREPPKEFLAFGRAVRDSENNYLLRTKAKDHLYSKEEIQDLEKHVKVKQVFEDKSCFKLLGAYLQKLGLPEVMCVDFDQTMAKFPDHDEYFYEALEANLEKYKDEHTAFHKTEDDYRVRVSADLKKMKKGELPIPALNSKIVELVKGSKATKLIWTARALNECNLGLIKLTLENGGMLNAFDGVIMCRGGMKHDAIAAVVDAGVTSVLSIDDSGTTDKFMLQYWPQTDADAIKKHGVTFLKYYPKDNRFDGDHPFFKQKMVVE